MKIQRLAKQNTYQKGNSQTMRNKIIF